MLLIQLASALPTEPFTPERLASPEGLRFSAALQAAMRGAGIERDRDSIEHALITSSKRVVNARNTALRPIDAWFHVTQTRQQWRLFLNPSRDCLRLHVEARRGPKGRWRTLYRALEIDRLGLARVLRYRRVRGIYNGSARRGPPANYPGFATWLAANVLERHPEYSAVRTRMEQLRIGPPGAAPASLGLAHVEVRTRTERP